MTVTRRPATTLGQHAVSGPSMTNVVRIQSGLTLIIVIKSPAHGRIYLLCGATSVGARALVTGIRGSVPPKITV